MAESSHGWKVGEEVCVHGHGFGRIEGFNERDVNPYAIVAIPRRDVHKPSGRVITWTEKRAVSLDVYPPHMSRSAR